MGKRIKTITAGRLVAAVCYTVAGPRDDAHQQHCKREMTTAAQERINLRRAWQKLEMLLAANFGSMDLHVVHTYDDEHLPGNKETALKRYRKMLRQLRGCRKVLSHPTRYIYVTEQLSSEGGRIHHHMVLNGTGHDVETLQSLWPYGNVEVECLDVWEGYEALAKYLTKEPREVGRCRLGERTWTPSIGLTKPEVESDYVKDNVTITLPPGAIVLARNSDNKGWGEYAYIKYLMPSRKEQKKGTRPPSRRKTA